MKELGLFILNKIYEYGYVGYIVGGFVRDYLLGIETNDIDITTNATPMELKNIFPDLVMTSESYGSVRISYNNYFFDVTTFRQEDDYRDNRHPSKITYVNDLKTDLMRRDFTINTICMDKDGKIIDLLNGQDDLKRKMLVTVIDSNKSFSLDALRILRAIRFASNLNFSMSDEIKDAIIKNKKLLRKLSYERKKRELDKIFGSSNAKIGINYLKEFHLDEDLELNNIEKIKDFSDINGIWAMLNTLKYPFTSFEKDLINKVNIVYEKDSFDLHDLYTYGLYVNVLAGINRGLNKKDIIEQYEKLPIKRKEDIDIKANEICAILNKKPGSFIGQIYKDLERKIIDNVLINNKEDITRYIKENYAKE